MRHHENNNIIIAIDGLHNLDMGIADSNKRTENIERATFIKGLTDKYKFPLLTTVELRKYGASSKNEDKIPDIDSIIFTHISF
jgi:hypothetical protein